MKKVTLLALNLQTWLEQASKALPKAKKRVVPAFPDPLTCVYFLLGGKGGVPLAALQAHRFRLAPSAHWLMAEPINCEADKQGVYCVGSAHLNITHEEVAQLVDTLNQHLSFEGMHLYAPTPQSWLLSSEHQLIQDAVPLSKILNQHIARFMPSTWKRLFVEFEMLLHQHPVNQARVRSGKPKINACWFSGSEPLQVMPSHVSSALLSNDPLISTLGDWVEAQTAALPSDFSAALDACEKEIDHLLIVPASESLSDFEARWLRPALDALSRQSCAHIEILAGDNVCYDIQTETKRIKIPFF